MVEAVAMAPGVDAVAPLTGELIPVLQAPHIFERDRTDRLRKHRPQNQVTVLAMPFRRAQFMRTPSPYREKTSTASPTFQVNPLFVNRE